MSCAPFVCGEAPPQCREAKQRRATTAMNRRLSEQPLQLQICSAGSLSGPCSAGRPCRIAGAIAHSLPMQSIEAQQVCCSWLLQVGRQARAAACRLVLKVHVPAGLQDAQHCAQAAGRTCTLLAGENGSKAHHLGACRWVGEVSVPAEAAVVDWVLSDAHKRHWDNNRLVDFHSAVQGALTTQQLAQVCRCSPVQVLRTSMHADAHANLWLSSGPCSQDQQAAV